MATTYSADITDLVLLALEQLMSAKNIWLSNSGKVLYFGEGRNMYRYKVNMLNFRSLEDARKLIAILGLKIDEEVKSEKKVM